MITNFLRGYADDRKRTEILLKTLNLDIIPRQGETVIIGNQKFHVQDVVFDTNELEYNVYMCRA